MYHYARKAHLALPSNVRWGTIHAMIESILNSTEAIKQVLRDARVSENRDLSVDAKDQLTFYETGENVQKLKEVELLLRPASLTIKKIESDTLNSTKAYFEAIQAMDEVAVQADHIIYLEVEVKEKIKQITEDRKKFAYSPVFHLVRILDPYDQGRSFTNQQKIEATQVLTKLMKHPDLIPNQAQAMTEWAQWKSEAGIFVGHARAFAWELLQSERLDSYTFWKGFFDDTVLAKVVSMLRPIAVTSAANERYWSVRGYNHSRRRSSLSSETAGMEAYISYNLKRIGQIQFQALPTMEPEPSMLMEPEEIEGDEGIPDYEFIPLDDDELAEDTQLFE